MIKVRFFKLKLIIGLFAFLTLIFGVQFVFSAPQIQVQESEISVETAPKNPQPYQEVTIRISSYATDLNKATITWQSDGGVVLSGIGKTSYTFKAPGADITARFNISITPPGGYTINKIVYITPADMDVFWQSENGHTPPFYKGRTLPVTKGSIKVVAIPNTKNYEDFSFVWKNKDKTMVDSSGYNKNYYIFRNSMFDKIDNITVTASSLENNYVAQKNIDIPILNPEIVFYKKDPALGIDYNNALVNNSSVTDEEITIFAEPYYFPTEENPAKFIYEWSINNKLIDTPTKKNELSIRPTSRGGYAIVNLDIYHINNMFQEAFNSIKINF